MDLAEILGNNLRGFRKRLKLTQATLAEKAELDAGYMGHVERGTANVSIEGLKKIAAALKVDAYVLLMKGSYLDAEKYQKK